MNIIYLSISPMRNMNGHSISLDLIHEFVKNGHNVYAVSSLEKRLNQETHMAEEAGCTVLRVRIGNNKKANVLEKGITTVTLPRKYISAIKKYLPGVKFDLVLYPTPPITHLKTVEYIKKRDGAKSYLLLKDIFPQNAVDIGMMATSGINGLLYRYFRKQEKKLYAISDYIGCMSQSNVDYILQHNPEINPEKVEICPNATEIIDKSISKEEKYQIRNKYMIPQDKKVFIYGGNLGKPQGIPFIIECLKCCKDIDQAFFLIVGDGTEYSKLNSFISGEKPANVKLMKRIAKEDYDTLVAACDVGLIFLDHRFTIPNFPSRLLGYMQARLPVLACTDPNTDIGKVIVNGGFGLWCESNKSEAFMNAIKQFLTDLPSFDRLNEGRLLNDYYSSNRAYNIIMQSIIGEKDK